MAKKAQPEWARLTEDVLFAFKAVGMPAPTIKLEPGFVGDPGIEIAGYPYGVTWDGERLWLNQIAFLAATRHEPDDVDVEALCQFERHDTYGAAKRLAGLCAEYRVDEAAEARTESTLAEELARGDD